MKRQFLTAAVAVVACMGLAVGTGSANHRHGGGYDCGGCAPVYQDCGPQYQQVQVTRYQQQWVEQEINEVVCRLVPKQENYSYTVQVPVMKAVKQMVTSYQTVQKEVAVPCTVMVPVTDNVKQVVTTYKHVPKEIEVPYTTYTHNTVARKVLQTTFQCVPEQVTHQVPVCRTIQVPCCDPCTGCVRYTCQRVVELQPVTCTVVRRVPTTTEVTVNEVVCTPVTQMVKRTISECVPVQQEITVPVCRMVAQQQTYKRLVCECVPVQQEVTVNVCHYETRQENATRTVYTQVQENVKRKVQVCQMVPYTTTETVAVGGSYCGYAQDCYSGHGHGRRGCCR